jgi:hypothetical protein
MDIWLDYGVTNQEYDLKSNCKSAAKWFRLRLMDPWLDITRLTDSGLVSVVLGLA